MSPGLPSPFCRADSKQDLRDKTDANDDTKKDLNDGIEASNRVLMQANAAVDRELRHEALGDLCDRVDDWKNHKVDHFGDLLLHGHFPVVTGKSEQQKEVCPHSALIDSTSALNLLQSCSQCKAQGAFIKAKL